MQFHFFKSEVHTCSLRRIGDKQALKELAMCYEGLNFDSELNVEEITLL